MTTMAEAPAINPMQVDVEFASIIVEAFGEQPLSIPLSESDDEAETYQQAAHFMGAVAVGGAVERAGGPDRSESYSLFDALRSAYYGDEAAESMVRTNALTDVIERSIKSGFVLRVEWDGNGANGIEQYGQTDAQIQANSLQHGSKNPKMQPRFAAEVRNMFRLRQALARGQLEDYALLVPSRAADDMSPAEAAKEGFFIDTMSSALQLTTLEGGVLTTESAFVSGVSRPGGVRHDGKTIQLLGERLGADWSGSAAQSLDRPILIHKSLIPNGVVDIVALHDECAAEVTGEDIFFGEAKPRNDYAWYRLECLEREASFAPIAANIASDLIAETPHIYSPQEASQRLNKLSAKHAISRAIEDDAIDARVFGVEAAAHIEQGRLYYAAQDFEMVEQAQASAVEVETSSTCPGGVGSGNGSDGEGSSSTEAGSDKYGSLEFECPKCKFTNTRPRGKLIPRCQRCNADVRC